MLGPRQRHEQVAEVDTLGEPSGIPDPQPFTGPLQVDGAEPAVVAVEERIRERLAEPFLGDVGRSSRPNG